MNRHNSIINKKSEFIDNEFDKSLTFLSKYGDEIVWKRPIEVCKKPKFISEDIEYADIHQGMIGDCWILSSIISLIKDRQYFYKIVNPFQQDDEFKRGKFEFNLYNPVSKNYQKVVIDDQLPYIEYKQKKQLKLVSSYNRNDTEEFWLPLLEKAIIKFLNGSYDKADKGGYGFLSSNVLYPNIRSTVYGNLIQNSFDGEPVKIFDIKYNYTTNNNLVEFKNQIENHLSKFKQNVGNVTAVTARFSIIDDANIERNHTYSILDVYNGNLLLYNPHGAESREANNSIKKPIEYFDLFARDYNKLSTDGCFWLSITNFLSTFSHVEFNYSEKESFYRPILNNEYKLYFEKSIHINDLFTNKISRINELKTMLENELQKVREKDTITLNKDVYGLYEKIYKLEQDSSINFEIKNVENKNVIFVVKFPQNTFNKIDNTFYYINYKEDKALSAQYLKNNRFYYFNNVICHFFNTKKTTLHIELIFSNNFDMSKELKLELYLCDKK